MSPSVLGYVVGQIALALLLVARHFGLVAQVSPWAYVAAIGAAQVSGRLVDRWPVAPRGSLRLHIRVVAHVAAVTSVIYLSGWGPALGMAYAFTALADLQQSGAAAWRAALGWSLVGCALGQMLVLAGWAPSFLNVAHAETIGFLGAFVFGIAIRMAGAVGEHTEQAEAALAAARDAAQRSEAHHRAVVENAAEGIYTVGLDGTIRSFNAAAETMFGWAATEIIGQPVATLTPPELHEHLAAFLAAYETEGPDVVQRSDITIAGVRRDGTQFPMKAATSVILVEGAPPIVSCIARDLSEQNRVEEQLAHQALHDALTGLPNRVMFTDHLDHALARVRRHHEMCAVLFVDLDRFKTVNDTLGHAAGDLLLTNAATRIRSAVRETDTVARLGGDEFVVLCENIQGVHHVTGLAERIIAALQRPFQLDGDDAHVSASIGIALCADGTDTADALIANGDLAMYRAKQNGRSRYELFDDAMQQWVLSQTTLEIALRDAVARDELRLYCQPVVDADTGKVRSFEALVRWDRPGFGLVGPDAFIPIAEETGLIVDIGAWVLEEACHHAATWARRWPERQLQVAVNISSRQLLTHDIVDVVGTALTRTALDPALLTLELTESTLIDDAVRVAPLLHALRDLGVNIALDDFGTGYSSLTYLRTFPFNIVKIDKSFIRAIGTGREDTAIVAAVIALAKNLDLRVVAEGIDNHDQLAVLLQLGCPYMQGYLFSPPTPIDQAPDLLQTATLGLIRSNNDDSPATIGPRDER